ncbi:MAG: PIN domain-containing protein [Verrucomicrobia bacterium]|jgi:predicted nucleic acid-binding protein|nr:PIN domain-containing protein [Verrucomicrobiota bacterium]
MQRYLLDTNMLVGFSRKAIWAKRTYETYQLGAPENMTFTSAICRGELLALAEKWGWGTGKRDALVQVLNQFPTVDINKESILNAYAAIDTWTHGKPVSSMELPTPPRPAVVMKQNDMWIAATAVATGATLLTTDKDFDHLDGVVLNRIWVDQAP